MDRDEEYRLIGLAQAGDREAMGTLLAQHDRGLRSMAVKVFNSRRPRGLDESDLQQIAAAEFIKCVREFDTSHGVRLTTFTYAFIPKRLQRAAYEQGLVRVPYSGRRTAPASAHRAIYRVSELSSPLHADDRRLRVADVWHKLVEDAEALRRIRQLIPELPDREWLVLQWWLEGVRMNDIAATMMVSKQRVFQLRNNAVRLLAIRMECGKWLTRRKGRGTIRRAAATGSKRVFKARTS
jgi:RNA polymerase sigma factor (sigma-70 family)